MKLSINLMKIRVVIYLWKGEISVLNKGKMGQVV